MKFIRTDTNSYVNTDKIIEIRVGAYQEGQDMKGIVYMYQVEAYMEGLGWTTIRDGFENEAHATRSLIKLVTDLQTE